MILLRWVRSSTIKTTDKGNWRLNRNVRQILLACSKGEDSYMFIILCVRRFCCIEFFDVMALQARQELAIKLKRNDENFTFSSVRKYRTNEHSVSLYPSLALMYDDESIWKTDTHLVACVAAWLKQFSIMTFAVNFIVMNTVS